MHKKHRYSSSIKPFINIRGLNIYPAPDYLLSELELFADEEASAIQGLIHEIAETPEHEYVVKGNAPQVVTQDIVEPVASAEETLVAPVITEPVVAIQAEEPTSVVEPVASAEVPAIEPVTEAAVPAEEAQS
jgi:hypothetical protein